MVSAQVDLLESEVLSMRFGLVILFRDDDFKVSEAVNFVSDQLVFKTFVSDAEDVNDFNGTIVDLHPKSNLKPRYDDDPYAFRRRWLLADSDHNRRLVVKSGPTFDSKVYLLASQNTSISISEMYLVGSHTVPTQRVVEVWINGTNSKDYEYIWRRRYDLKGMKLKIGALNYPSMITVDHEDPTKATGFSAELLMILSKGMNFTFEYIQPERNVFGTNTEAEEWTGLAGLLVRNEVDISANLVPMTYERTDDMNFSRGITMEQSVFVYRDQYGTIIPLQRVFSSEVIAIFVTIFFVLMGIAVFISWLYRKGRFFHFYILEIVLITLASITNQGFQERLSVSSMRILLYTSLLLGLLFVQVLSARLASLVSVHMDYKPINTFEEVIDQKRNLYVLGQSSREEYFSKANCGSSAHEIWNNQMSLEDYFHPPNLTSLMDNAMADESGVLWVNPVVFKLWAFHHRKEACVLNIRRERRSIHQAFGVRKDWPYLPSLNYRILKAIETGLVSQLQEEWHHPQHLEPESYCPRREEEQKRVGIRDIKAYWYILCGGIGVGMVLFLGEYLGKKRQQYKAYRKYRKATKRRRDMDSTCDSILMETRLPGIEVEETQITFGDPVPNDERDLESRAYM
ncbi:hypothetical protein TCAL_14963 [Tigriopus californicus]|uniref:Ionotropic glutamate receptor L-glutamate and glycine-binding domain-containing protein n=2 Tax=Tigriopus californicus TaxID=6832 RepID=A0A553N789_TIGCA|nr:hypothetical protein TCAL_14963 [Tigriopus californicus]